MATTHHARFVEGYTLRHIIKMAAASTLGLLMLFSSDLVDMYFLSQLGNPLLVSAVGFAGTLVFFTTAVGIGLQVAMGALVSRSIGAGHGRQASMQCSSVLLYSFLFGVLMFVPMLIFLSPLLTLLGAGQDTLALAMSYSHILLPATPFMAVGMGAAAALRSLGDAKRSMYVTMISALVNIVLDVVFIFGFGWGLEGAAWATFLSRVVLMLLAVYWIVGIHRLPVWITPQYFLASLKGITAIAGPAMLTSLATPLASSYVIKTMATYGDEAVAGSALVGRIVPVTFAAIFAISGAVGPILGQNAGANRYDRVRHAIIEAVWVNIVYCLFAWLVLYLLRYTLVDAFSATGITADLIVFYCQYLVGGFLFSGMLFIANASFNNLGQAYMATIFNFSRTLLGIVPFVYFFSQWYGPRGVLTGEVVGVSVFGVLALYMALRRVAYLQRHAD